MHYAVCLTVAVLVLFGCDKKEEEPVDVVPVLLVLSVPTYSTDSRSVIANYQFEPLLRLDMVKTDTYSAGQWKSTVVQGSIRNLTGYYVTANFVVSGPGWEYQGAVEDLPPYSSVDIGVLTTTRFAFTNVTSFVLGPPLQGNG